MLADSFGLPVDIRIGDCIEIGPMDAPGNGFFSTASVIVNNPALTH